MCSVTYVLLRLKELYTKLVFWKVHKIQVYSLVFCDPYSQMLFEGCKRYLQLLSYGS